MFCSKCGTQIEDTAVFCYNCGSPVSPSIRAAKAPQQPANQQPTYQQQPANQQPTYQQQPAYQQPAYQPQPAAYTDYRTCHLEKFGVNIVYPDGRYNEIGDLYLTENELIFVKKSKAVRVAFGFLGSAAENGEERLRIRFADIVGGQKTKIGLNFNVYQITLRSGETYKICVNNPSKIACLQQRFG